MDGYGDAGNPVHFFLEDKQNLAIPECLRFILYAAYSAPCNKENLDLTKGQILHSSLSHIFCSV